MDYSAHLTVLVFFIKSVNGYAQICDSLQCCCEKNDMNPSGIMIGHPHPKKIWMISYRYMNMFMNNNLSGTKKVSDETIFQNYIMSPTTMNMDMHMVMVMYGLSNKLSVMGMLNYNVLSMNMSMLPGTMHMHMSGMTMPEMNATSMSTKTSGLSDIKIYAVYNLFDRAHHKLLLSGGLNVPSGKINLDGDSKSLMYEGQRLPYMLQLGSGTFDILPGLTYLLSKDRLTWGSQLSGIIRSGYNSESYAYGNELTANSWLAYKLASWFSISGRLEASQVETIYGKDPKLYEIMEPGSKTTNYGGQRASGFMGANFYLKNFAHSKLSFEYGLPFYQKLNGTQLAIHSMLYAGWAVSF